MIYDNGIWTPDPNYTIFVKPTNELMTQRRLEAMDKFANLRAWGLRNPTKFMSLMFGVEPLDSQVFAIENSWTRRFALWLCSRGYGKSTWLGIYAMGRGMLIPNFRGYIAAGTSDQSIETFNKIEAIAKKQIESMIGLTDVFINELVSNQKNNDGFIHNPSGFTFTLYNGSFVKTLNSNINAKRGKRAEWVCFDECGWLDEEVFSVIEPYTVQNKNFKVGKNLNVLALPKELPNQLMYTSSASSVDSEFYKKYRQYTKEMIAGNPDYFVCDMDCNVVLNATMHGKLWPAAQYDQSTIDRSMKGNREKALREYHNEFSTDAGADAVVKRAIITRNSVVRPPITKNNGNQTFVFSWDPARSFDNSVVGIAEEFEDAVKGWQMRMANCVNFMNAYSKNQTPLGTPAQIIKFRELLLQYNGDAMDYKNIEAIYLDGGAGGGGKIIADTLAKDWYEEGHEGDPRYKHCGIVDPKLDGGLLAKENPNALHILHITEPASFKAESYEAMRQICNDDLVEFTSSYDNKGFLSIIEVDQKKYERAKTRIESELSKEKLSPEEFIERLDEELEKLDLAKTVTYRLSRNEELALTQLDTQKEEIVNMVRIPNKTGKDSFELCKEKRGTLHDDRSDVAASLMWHLLEKRRNSNRKPKNKIDNLADILPIKQAKTSKMIG